MKTIKFDVDGYYRDLLTPSKIYKCIFRDESGKVKFERISDIDSLLGLEPKKTRLYRPQEINYGDYKVEAIETKEFNLNADYYCI